MLYAPGDPACANATPVAQTTQSEWHATFGWRKKKPGVLADVGLHSITR
jgi:hypothetical protein